MPPYPNFKFCMRVAERREDDFVPFPADDPVHARLAPIPARSTLRAPSWAIFEMLKIEKHSPASALSIALLRISKF